MGYYIKNGGDFWEIWEEEQIISKHKYYTDAYILTTKKNLDILEDNRKHASKSEINISWSS